MMEIGGIGIGLRLAAIDDTAPGNPVDPGQVGHFEGLMQGGATPATEVRPPEAMAGMESGAVRGTPTLGETILNSIQQMREAHEERVRALNAAVDGKVVQMEELLAAQLALTRLTFEQDLIAKTASKATQNLDTLLKSQ